jgi:hypothetical protein
MLQTEVYLMIVIYDRKTVPVMATEPKSEGFKPADAGEERYILSHYSPIRVETILNTD